MTGLTGTGPPNYASTYAYVEISSGDLPIRPKSDELEQRYGRRHTGVAHAVLPEQRDGRPRDARSPRWTPPVGG
jgi:hypothetical protein